MHLSKKLSASVVLAAVALVSCQLMVGCGDSNVNGDMPGAGRSGSAGEGDGGSAGKPAGGAAAGKAGAPAHAGETNGGSGAEAGEMDTGGNPGAGTSGGGAGGASGGGAGGASGGGAGGASGGGASGTAGNAGHGGTAGVGGAGAGGLGGAGAGAGGSAGVGGTAGNAGHGGTAGSAGTGGMSGGAGTGGMAGGSTCGNGTLDAGEICDTKFTVNNCGADCKAITATACFTCENDPGTCKDFVDCGIAIGNAPAGTPAAGVARSALCNEVLDCVRDSKCGEAGHAPIYCYCGTASGADCQAGLANGACKTQIERGLEATSFTTISARFKNIIYGGGVAMARLDCDQNACSTECALGM